MIPPTTTGTSTPSSDRSEITSATAPESVFAAGRVSGVFELQEQIADGRRAGLEAARLLGRYDGPIPERPTHRGPPPSHPHPIFAHAKKKCFVDLDEDLHLADLVNAHQEGYDNIELLKRYTTVGMGPSQGKLANMNAIRILAKRRAGPPVGVRPIRSVEATHAR